VGRRIATSLKDVHGPIQAVGRGESSEEVALSLESNMGKGGPNVPRQDDNADKAVDKNGETHLSPIIKE